MVDIRISLAIDQKQYSIGVFFDPSKAFYTLNHHILLHKLQYYGIRGLPLKLFASYLHDRQQYVNMNHVIMVILICNLWCSTRFNFRTITINSCILMTL